MATSDEVEQEPRSGGGCGRKGERVLPSAFLKKSFFIFIRLSVLYLHQIAPRLPVITSCLLTVRSLFLFTASITLTEVDPRSRITTDPNFRRSTDF